ncbi:MAG: hypothetical protein GY788_29780 [bacterium]|nr:hypothetical protein [bacterium]
MEPSPDPRTVADLEHRVALLEQGMKQAAHIRKLWTKATRELKKTKSELQGSLAELTIAHEQLEAEMELRERMEAELRLSQKLESIGQLAAGVAHEINTPIQYIGDNTLFVQEVFESVQSLLGVLAPLVDTDGSEPVDGALSTVARTIQDEDLFGLAEEIPAAIAETLEGIGQVAHIVSSMKEFSKPGSKSKCPVDINRALETTVTVARSEWSSVAEIEWVLDADLPQVHAISAELNQVFLNVLVNASQAIGSGESGRGLIRIVTKLDGSSVVISVADSGTGIPSEVIDSVFDPFFTTKDVGSGLGQGLSIARSIVVDHHAGSIEVQSEMGIGSTFEIRLPIRAPDSDSSQPADQDALYAVV